MTFPYFPIATPDLWAAPDRGYQRMAKLTGERRAPRRGEWYISGAIAEAYYAPNDLSTSYRIAKIVKGSLEWREDS